MTPPKKKTVIIDTDSGFDDILAISALINNSEISVPFIISTVGGIHECPYRASKFLDTIYPTANVVAGLSIQELSNEVPSWLLEYRRKLDTLVCPNNGDDIDKDVTTVELHTSLQQTLQQYPDQSVDLLCLGPLTNIASWVNDKKASSLLDNKLKSICIMGGNTPDSNNDKAEYNFAQDPNAAQAVLTNPILRNRISLVTAQACSKNVIDDKAWDDIIEKSQAGKGILSKVFEVESSKDTFKYDPVSAFVLANLSNSDLVSVKATDVIIDQESGLLIGTSNGGGSERSVSIKFVDEVKIGSEYLSFINDAIANDPDIYQHNKEALDKDKSY